MNCGCGQKSKDDKSKSSDSFSSSSFLSDVNDFLPGREHLSLVEAIQFIASLATLVILFINIKK